MQGNQAVSDKVKKNKALLERAQQRAKKTNSINKKLDFIMSNRYLLVRHLQLSDLENAVKQYNNAVEQYYKAVAEKSKVEQYNKEAAEKSKIGDQVVEQLYEALCGMLNADPSKMYELLTRDRKLARDIYKVMVEVVNNINSRVDYSKVNLFTVSQEQDIKQRAALKKLHTECAQYKKHLENKLRKATSVEKEGEMEVSPDSHKSSAQVIREKLSIVNDLLSQITDKDSNFPLSDIRTKLEAFRNKLEEPGVRDTLAKHRDSDGVRFLKNVGYILSSLFFGAGLIYSYKTKGTAAFWKSHGNASTTRMDQLLAPVTTATTASAPDVDAQTLQQ